MDLHNKSDLETYIESRESSKLRPLLVDVNLQKELIDEAVEHCQTIITEDPGSPYGYYLLALAEIKRNETDSAVEHLKQTVDLDYGFLDAYKLLVEIGKDKLAPGALKACYEKIIELDPFDDNAITESGRISEEADRGALKDITLPEIKVHKTISRAPVEESTEESDTVAAPEPTPEPEAPEQIEKTPELTPDKPAETSEAETAAPAVALEEEEAHLGPMIPEEEEGEPQLGEELEDDDPTNSDSPVETGVGPEPAPEPETVPDPEPQEKEESVKEKPVEPEPPSEKPVTETPPPPRASAGPQPSALSDMFAKLKSKPLEEVQKENWSLPVVEAPAPPSKPDELVKKPNVKFTVPLKEKEDPKKKLEAIHKEIGLTGKINSADDQESEKKKESVEPAIGEDEKEVPSKNQPTSPKASPKKTPKIKTNGNKVELKIPVPTFTLVDVFKKQKLYDEALELLNVLEKKTKTPERIEKERQEIMTLKMEEES